MPRRRNLIARNPNAAVGAVSAGGLGTIVALLFRWAGVELEPEAASAIAGGLAGLALWIGREGIKGLARRVWRGSEG